MLTCEEIEMELDVWAEEDVPVVAEIVSLYTPGSSLPCEIESGETDSGDPWVAVVEPLTEITLVHVANDTAAGVYIMDDGDEVTEAGTPSGLLQEIEEKRECTSLRETAPPIIGRTSL